MEVNGINGKKRISINNDFSIIINSPCVYLTDFIDDNLLVVLRPAEKITNYKEGIFSVDDDMQVNGNFKLKLSGTFTHDEEIKNYKPEEVLENYDIGSMLKKMSEEAKNISLNILINDNSNSYGDDEFKRMYKVCIDTPVLKVGYYTMGMFGKTTYVPVIFTTHAAYTGQILFPGDNFEKDTEWIESLLNTLEPLNVEQEKINEVKNEDLETISYTNDIIEAGSLIVKKANELDYVSKENLPEKFDLIATSKSYKKSKLKYNDAPVGICINKPIVSDVLTEIWKMNKNDIEKNLIDNFKNSLIRSLGSYDKEVKLLKHENKYAIIYGQANSAQPDEPYWTSYGFAIFHNDMMYYGMLYFNCNKPKESDVLRIVEDFLNNITIDNKKAEKSSQDERIRMLGEFSADDGKIDAIKVNNLFFDDVIFNNPEEIVYKNNKHTITGLQLNANLVDLYPQIQENSRIFIKAIYDLVTYLENNNKIVVDVNAYHKNFNNITNGEPITGITYFLMAAWHMIKIVEVDENEYQVLIDDNIIRGLPHGYSLLMEYINALRKYNGKTNEYKATFIGAKNFDGPIGLIRNTVDNADRFESSKTISSNDSMRIEDNDSNDFNIIKNIDINILKYLNHKIPDIYKMIQNKINSLEKNKEKILSHRSLSKACDEIMNIKDDDLGLNMSYRSTGDNGSISLEINLEQLKIDGITFHPFAEFIINYDFNENENTSTFYNEIIELYKSYNEVKIRDELIQLLIYYKNNDIQMKMSKEKLFVISKIYDYDKEDLNFKREDFFKEKIGDQSQIEKKQVSKDFDYNKMIEKYNNDLQEIRNEWDKDFNEYQEYISSKVYQSTDEITEDFKIIGEKQVKIQNKINKLIVNIDKDVSSIKNVDTNIYMKIVDIFEEIVSNLDDFTLDLGLSGTSSEKLGKFEVKLEEKVLEIIQKYKNKCSEIQPKEKQEKDKFDNNKNESNLKKKIEKKIKELKKESQKQIDIINKDNETIMQNIGKLEKEKSSLGLFKVSEKKNIVEKINKLEEELSKNKSKIESLNNNEKVKELEEKLEFLNMEIGEFVDLGKDPINREKISWIVLDNNSDGILLISDKTLDLVSYYDSEKWLKDFEKNCLNDDIRNALVKNGGRKDVNTNVFILSEAELNENLNDLEADSTTQLEEREVEAQKNGFMKGTPQATKDKWIEDSKRRVKSYWVRGKVDSNGFAKYVGKKVDSDEYFVSIIGAGAPFAIRPAMLIKIEEDD